VLDEAQGQAKEATDNAVSPGLRLKWRIVEEEPEVATLKDVRLVLELKSGRSVVVKPLPVAQPISDDKSLVLLWGEHIDFRFLKPEGVSANDVERSRLMLTGFYERYGPVLAAEYLLCRVLFQRNRPASQC
jgi:hypothetical protein